MLGIVHQQALGKAASQQAGERNQHARQQRPKLRPGQLRAGPGGAAEARQNVMNRAEHGESKKSNNEKLPLGRAEEGELCQIVHGRRRAGDGLRPGHQPEDEPDVSEPQCFILIEPLEVAPCG